MSDKPMNESQARVADLIRSAFQGVKLGNGVGLKEGQALDDCLGDKIQAEYRLGDEKRDWSQIPIAKLNQYNTSTSFFDAEGMRFHLPAFLIADLQGLYDYGMVDSLIVFTDHDDVVFQDHQDSVAFRAHQLERFSLLNNSQRQAVREFLLLRHEELKREGFSTRKLARILEEYWTQISPDGDH